MRDLTAKDIELLAQHEDLNVLGPITPTAQHQQPDHRAEHLVDDRHDRHRRRHPLWPRNRTSKGRTEFRAPTGANRIIWASDYPHPDAKFPGVTEELAEALADLAWEQKRAITSESAKALYGID